MRFCIQCNNMYYIRLSDNDGGNLNRNRYRVGAITSQSYNGFKPFIFDEAFYNYRTNRYFRKF